MADAKVICLEQARADRMKPVRFHTVAEVDRKIAIDLQGTFAPAAARILANAILQRCDAVAFDNANNPKADR